MFKTNSKDTDRFSTLYQQSAEEHLTQPDMVYLGLTLVSAAENEIIFKVSVVTC